MYRRPHMFKHYLYADLFCPLLSYLVVVFLHISSERSSSIWWTPDSTWIPEYAQIYHINWFNNCRIHLMIWCFWSECLFWHDAALIKLLPQPQSLISGISQDYAAVGPWCNLVVSESLVHAYSDATLNLPMALSSAWKVGKGLVRERV